MEKNQVDLMTSDSDISTNSNMSQYTSMSLHSNIEWNDTHTNFVFFHVGFGFERMNTVRIEFKITILTFIHKTEHRFGGNKEARVRFFNYFDCFVNDRVFPQSVWYT